MLRVLLQQGQATPLHIKHIIFDLDGVLVDSRMLHYQALNNAIHDISPRCVISPEEHLSTYDGLSTTKKLNLLTENKGLDPSLHSDIWKKKQSETITLINSIKPNQYLINVLKTLHSSGLSVHVASNAIKRTVKVTLVRLGLIEYIDEIYSNEDVKNPKPNPEIYMRSMIKAGVSPKETLIIEDSHIGRKGAIESGAHLCAVSDPKEVTLEKIKESIHLIDKNIKEVKPKWLGGEMNVLIPMAGAGSRFQEAGYTFPKPLIEVNGQPMIQTVVDNLNIDARHIFIVQKEHYEKFHLKNLLNAISPKCEIVQVDGITDGAACTSLLAKEFIDNDKPLLIANSDQYIDWDSNEFMYSMVGDKVDGGILTFKSSHPKWSYVKLDDEGFASEVAEKNPISSNATVGVYFWTKGSDYVRFAERMIESDKNKVNGEFYICPVFNEAITDKKKIKSFNVSKMWGLGTPEDLQEFLRNH